MFDPITALTSAIDNSTKVANSSFFSTIIDRLLGFKISEWGAQGEVFKRHILDSYEEAKQKGMGFQYMSALRENTNLINVGSRAAKYIDSSKVDEMEFDNDVLWGLINHSKKISNDEMQELIAKIIAGEYNAPGMYSMSTLQTVKMLGKNELELFEKMCSLLVNSNQIPKTIFTFPEGVKVFLSPLGLDFGNLQTLQSLGLFLPNDMNLVMENPTKNDVAVQYFSHQLIFTPENDNFSKIKLPGFYGLSLVGKQLLKHVKPKIIDDYYSWLKENYKIPNYKLK